MLQRTEIKQYVYPGEVLRVVDGDTVNVRLILIDTDLGFNAVTRLTHDIKLRLGGINAPEMSTQEGKNAKQYLSSIIAPGTQCIVYTVKDRTEKYGRYLAWIYIDNNVCVNDLMISSGNATEYNPSGIVRPDTVDLYVNKQ